MANVFLVFGNAGAGKSTFASTLAVKEDAYIFTIDEWMRNLFMMDMPTPPSYEWALERVCRAETQILQEAKKLNARGIPVILDIGFFSFQQRDRVRAFCRAQGMDVVQYFLDVDKATRWQRIEQRNVEKGETFNIHVSEQVFEFCETIFEPLTADEMASVAVITS